MLRKRRNAPDGRLPELEFAGGTEEARLTAEKNALLRGWLPEDAAGVTVSADSRQ